MKIKVSVEVNDTMYCGKCSMQTFDEAGDCYCKAFDEQLLCGWQPDYIKCEKCVIAVRNALEDEEG